MAEWQGRGSHVPGRVHKSSGKPNHKCSLFSRRLVLLVEVFGGVEKLEPLEEMAEWQGKGSHVPGRVHKSSGKPDHKCSLFSLRLVVVEGDEVEARRGETRVSYETEWQEGGVTYLEGFTCLPASRTTSVPSSARGWWWLRVMKSRRGVEKLESHTRPSGRKGDPRTWKGITSLLADPDHK
ncbi:hypothetical protein BO70DRAFT_350682 [Aspergillus heteromorphus CBS 117.55]|uniref:Uncharacterized protein n=1 Tax=Aspergillus heteromorphus CBS 117.55 TaxID=1448321 RepID=A0A317WPG0_9EURO|nr:uncharacterized protein BO70DRAFT_350682 [Aspergillus heteromorphus CBS 117.55]PWY88303.1 hypothetical protein BO70DRAFT_350682 [Aspergillus heteromorphus CBS 117.55]